MGNDKGQNSATQSSKQSLMDKLRNRPGIQAKISHNAMSLYRVDIRNKNRIKIK